jgi:DNA-directed RNA polymerase subunit RPC12/RpoP
MSISVRRKRFRKRQQFPVSCHRCGKQLESPEAHIICIESKRTQGGFDEPENWTFVCEHCRDFRKLGENCPIKLGNKSDKRRAGYREGLVYPVNCFLCNHSIPCYSECSIVSNVPICEGGREELSNWLISCRLCLKRKNSADQYALVNGLRKFGEGLDWGYPWRGIEKTKKVPAVSRRFKDAQTYPCLCSYCDKELTRETATTDHIVPVSEGGPDIEENMAIACERCNVRRAKRLTTLLYLMRRKPGEIPYECSPRRHRMRA